MKTIAVVAAIIMKDGMVFATQRGYGEWKGWWEFPGGKIEEQETPEDALKREIREELAIDIEDLQFFMTVEYDYPSFHLSMDCFICTVHDTEPVLMEHIAGRWLDMDELDSLTWLPADVQIIERIKAACATSGTRASEVSFDMK